ncbi:MAG: PP2C family protein-serine/threonine phosphatase [Longimicrobiales bacterium]
MNQDAVLAVRLPDGRELVAVADGMGGHSAGEVASQRALETVWTQLKAGADLRGAVMAANAAVHAAAAGNPGWSGMGTTLVAMLRAGSSYEIANVGDSRAYRITPDALSQITTDHSFVAEAVRESRFATDEIARSRWRNALTRSLGTEADVNVDCFGPFDAREPHAVLLCSDGLYRTLSDDVLQQHVARADDPWAAARSLTAEAYRNGSADNISAAVVLFGEGATQLSRIEGRAVPPSDSASARFGVPAPTRASVGRRRRRSRRARRADIQLAAVIVLLIVIVAVLMRVW